MEGDIVKKPILARTLRALQKDPFALKNGTLAEGFARDVRKYHGILTSEDLKNYK